MTTRNNAWNNGGTFDNPDLLWYAKGVGEMMSRPLNDPNSWWFYAAIHGEYIDLNRNSFPRWEYIPGPPAVPTSPLPSPSDRDVYWKQCQHQSWFFPPWHRGYLIALEAHVRAAVVSLGGPESWALPYWDYLGPDNQYEMPPAFSLQTLPDGAPNPLFVVARYGPNGDGNIFVETGTGPYDANGKCMTNDLYTGSNTVTPRPGYGGPQTGFSHGGDTSGNLEGNPHNLVHVDVGGQSPAGERGLMAFPGTAALDPVFYFHHSNIDRMWAQWNADGNSNPSDANWLSGPAANGEREFIMPMPDGSSWKFTPADVDSLTKVDYTYDNLPAQQPVQPGAILAARLDRLGAAASAMAETQGSKMDTATDSELVGANEGALQLTSSGAQATVNLDGEVRRKVSASLMDASAAAPPDRVYLQLENVRGAGDAQKLKVSVNGQPAGAVALFGLLQASLQDDQHGGSGLTLELDITDIIDTLHLDDALDVDSLDVKIEPSNKVQDDDQITIGRVSVHREGHK